MLPEGTLLQLGPLSLRASCAPVARGRGPSFPGVGLCRHGLQPTPEPALRKPSRVLGTAQTSKTEISGFWKHLVQGGQSVWHICLLGDDEGVL